MREELGRWHEELLPLQKILSLLKIWIKIVAYLIENALSIPLRLDDHNWQLSLLTELLNPVSDLLVIGFKLGDEFLLEVCIALFKLQWALWLWIFLVALVLVFRSRLGFLFVLLITLLITFFSTFLSFFTFADLGLFQFIDDSLSLILLGFFIKNTFDCWFIEETFEHVPLRDLKHDDYLG